MALYGYARVSSGDQDLAVQQAALAAAGCTVIREEKRTGTRLDGRDELRTILDFARVGDVLVVTRLDRLARSSRDLHNILHELQERGIGLRCTDQAIDTTTPEGRLFFAIVGAFSQFETEIRRARQAEGIEAAKAKGDVYRGRQPSVPVGEVRRLSAEGQGPAAIAKALGIGRTSVYRALSKVGGG
ncbi:recombinase family protein [Roseomonas mucosa]